MKNNDKDDNLGNDSSFLTRWSKRKSESNEVSSKSEQNEKNTLDVKDELKEEENKLSNDELAENIGLDYIANSPNRTALIEGCLELLDYLNAKYELHIITNGFEEVQHKKLLNSQINSYFNEIITSEAAGCKKPKTEIFDYALKKSGAQRAESVMIGDDLNTDIQGAVDFKMKAIYFNPNGKKHDFNLLGDVSHLLEIKAIL